MTNSSNNDFATLYLEDLLLRMKKLKEQADSAIEQVPREDFFYRPNSKSNSLAIIVKHMAGNFRSRWTDFLNSDGEKRDRDRDSEFVIDHKDSYTSLMQAWTDGWNIFLLQFELLTNDDLSKSIKIRGESLSVLEAINRATEHVAFHIGQIVYLAKFISEDNWKSLSIDLFKSQEFNEKVGYK